MTTVYYNEFDKYAADWLVELIAAGHIAPGVVDTRSIEDVHPADLKDFTQCHFFAGIGVWSLALRRAGWPDDRPVWTGSCPCQPFSAAGQGAGFADERHLWPAFHHLIRQHRPAVVLGEQVASKDADPWIDLVQDDMEGVGYRFGAIPFPSAGVGAPHIRDRLYWVAAADGGTGGKGRAHVRGRADRGHAQPRAGLSGGRVLDGLDHADHARLEGLGSGHQAARGQREGSIRSVASSSEPVRLADATSSGRGWGEGQLGGVRTAERCEAGAHGEPGPTNGYWRAADWLGCRDGKWRPVEPGTFPLAHGAAARVGRLRAYGNAINAEAARVFIEAVMEAT
ncbi:DNA cytosine methyltransferase [Massilia timonae]|uniref:DNA cytosine methyltransferase n=1 Tax=Massilia timonae TaxID=47229 RepID=UPI0008F57028|nr:DNA cytosine methyltransferase [Massilia timonae]